MKHSAIYIGIALILSIGLSGCTQEYMAEKLYWNANTTLANLPKEAGSITKEQYEATIKAFRKVTEKAPLSDAAAQSHFVIAQLYTMQENFPKAIEELEMVGRNFSNFDNLASRAQFMIARIYQSQNDWKNAEAAYERIMDLYPLSSIGLKTPIYLAEYYKENFKDQQESIDKAYKSAVRHYKKIILKFSGTSIEPVIKDYLALCYISESQWDEAIKVWQEIASQYPDSQAGINSLFSMGEVFVREIKDFERAIETYRAFVENNPTSRILKQAKFQIGRLYYMKQDYEKARESFGAMIKDYADDKDVSTEAMLGIAESYRQEGNWEKEKEVYEDIKAKYPDTKMGYSVPLFISRHYRLAGDIQEADRIFDQAISDYKEKIEKTDSSKTKIMLLDIMSIAFITQQRWAEAIDALNTLVVKYPNNEKSPTALFTIASIYEGQLKQSDMAIKAYQKFVEQYPEHNLATLAKSKIEDSKK